MNTAFPQSGIITSLDTTNNEAVVAIPIFNIETESAPIIVSDTPLEVGDEVIILFLNGDLHRPIVIGKIGG